MGGGGKTALLHALALYLFRAGASVLVSTTTKMNAPRLPGLLLKDSIEDLELLKAVRCTLRRRRLVALLTSPDGGVGDKRTGLSPDRTDLLWSARVASHIVTEADGSRQKPLKAWAEHEPPIPSRTTLLCAVLGADRMDEPLDEEHVFRLELMERNFGLKRGERLTPDRLALMMNSPAGGLKNAPAGARKLLFLNRADLLPRSRRSDLAARFLPKLASRLIGWDSLLMGSLRERRIDVALTIPLPR